MNIKTDHRVIISPLTQVQGFTVLNDSIVISFTEAGESFELVFNSSALFVVDELIKSAQDCQQKLIEIKEQQKFSGLNLNSSHFWNRSPQPAHSDWVEDE